MKVKFFRCSRRLFIILASQKMTWFSEKMLISTRCISGFMPNLHKKILKLSTHYIPWSQIIVDLCHCITTCTSTCHWSPVFQIFIGLCHSIILASTCISACHWPSGQLYLLLWWRWSWIVMANFWLNIKVSTVMEFWLWLTCLSSFLYTTIRDHLYKEVDKCSRFLTPTPLCLNFFITIPRQIW